MVVAVLLAMFAAVALQGPDDKMTTVRAFVYTERFGPLGPGPYDLDTRAVRDAGFKVFDRGRGPNLYFDLRGRNEITYSQGMTVVENCVYGW